ATMSAPSIATAPGVMTRLPVSAVTTMPLVITIDTCLGAWPETATPAASTAAAATRDPRIEGILPIGLRSVRAGSPYRSSPRAGCADGAPRRAHRAAGVPPRGQSHLGAACRGGAARRSVTSAHGGNTTRA